jgi:hypothetical protein
MFSPRLLITVRSGRIDWSGADGIVEIAWKSESGIVNSCVLTFFDRYVAGVYSPSVLDEIPSRFDEVRLLRKAR